MFGTLTLNIYILISKCLNHFLTIAMKNTICSLPCIPTYLTFTEPRCLYLCNLLYTYSTAQII